MLVDSHAHLDSPETKLCELGPRGRFGLTRIMQEI